MLRTPARRDKPQGQKGKSPKELPCPHKAEPNVEVPEARKASGAIGGTQGPRTVVPTTATNNAVGPGGGMQRVNPAGQFISVFILHPFPHISVHVKEAVRVRFQFSHGMGLIICIATIPSVIFDGVIAKGMGTHCLSSRCKLPFRLRGQTVTALVVLRSAPATGDSPIAI